MGDSNQARERRRSVRVEVDLPLSWQRVHFDHEEPPRPARAVDLSEGGVRMALSAGDELSIGDVIRIELGTSDLTVTRRGLVVSTRDGVHVAFRSAEGAESGSVMSAMGQWAERRARA